MSFLEFKLGRGQVHNYERLPQKLVSAFRTYTAIEVWYEDLEMGLCLIK